MLLEIKVLDMVCSGCEEIITNAIKTVDNNAKIKTDLNGKILSVETNISQDVIQDVITNAGYTIA
jgi:copper chaperone